MVFKFAVLLAAVACAHAGLAPVVTHYSPAATVSGAYINTFAAPAAYAAPVATVHDPHYGATSQSVIRSLGGGQAVSHYTKAVDGAFSSVRKYDTRVTNDAVPVAYAAAPVLAKTYAAPIAHTPIVTKTAVAYSPAVAVAHATFAGFGAHYEW